MPQKQKKALDTLHMKGMMRQSGAGDATKPGVNSSSRTQAQYLESQGVLQVKESSTYVTNGSKPSIKEMVQSPPSDRTQGSITLYTPLYNNICTIDGKHVDGYMYTMCFCEKYELTNDVIQNVPKFKVSFWKSDNMITTVPSRNGSVIVTDMDTQNEEVVPENASKKTFVPKMLKNNAAFMNALFGNSIDITTNATSTLSKPTIKVSNVTNKKKALKNLNEIDDNFLYDVVDNGYGCVMQEHAYIEIPLNKEIGFQNLEQQLSVYAAALKTSGEAPAPVSIPVIFPNNIKQVLDSLETPQEPYATTITLNLGSMEMKDILVHRSESYDYI